MIFFISLVESSYIQKRKDQFGCYEKVYDKFPETLIDKAHNEKCSKENISVKKVPFYFNYNC